MNPYNFIFSFFYFFGSAKANKSRFNAIMHVFFTFSMHIGFLEGIFMDIYGIRDFSKYTDFGSSNANKGFLLITSLPIIIVLFFIYNKTYCNKIIKEYQAKKYTKPQKYIRVFSYTILPTILVVVFALIRQGIIKF